MEHLEPESDEPTSEQANGEREPQPSDIAIATREVIKQLMPDADPQDVEESIADIEGAVDFEEALGSAVSNMAMLGIDYNEALALLAEILHIEEIRPGGDQGEIDQD